MPEKSDNIRNPGYVLKYSSEGSEKLLDWQIMAGHALGIWICGCSLFYIRELWASKSAGAHSTKSLKFSG